MVIGLCYDLHDTYTVSDHTIYKDFSFLSEVELVEKSLRKLGHKVILINGLNLFVKNILGYKHDCDIIFNMIEGYKSRNREGLIPALCEAFDIPYTGTDAFGMSLTLNKYHMNQIIKSFDINTPRAFLLDYPIDDHLLLTQIKIISYPCVLKPNHEGSSMGVRLIHSGVELYEQAHNMSKLYQQQLVVEDYIPGIELSIGIIGTASKAETYSCLQFVHEDGTDINFFDYECKYNSPYKAIVPRINKHVLQKIRDQSLFIHRIMNLQDISRIDWRVNNNIPYFIEATPLPAFDNNSDFDIGSRLNGEHFEDVLDKVLLSAIMRWEDKKNAIVER